MSLPPLLLLLLLSSSLLFGGNVLCDELRITSAEKLIELSKNVSSGTTYSGTTVFLDSDIVFTDELSQTFSPIGISSSKNFIGTFDGQGYTISNLATNISSQYVGLFGFSYGLTIKNVVIDPSCSITSNHSYKYSPPFVGGIISYCQTYSNQCIIENSINMASVTFNGIITNYALYIGGLFGHLYSPNYYELLVKNCANYGHVSHIGTSKTTNIGGIGGYFSGSSSNVARIQNCINYGTLTNNNTNSGDEYIGGLIGKIYYTTLDNCVNFGEITFDVQSKYIGSIAGHLQYSQISHCYWDKNTSENPFGSKASTSILNCSYFDLITLELSESVSIGSYTGISLINILNAASDYYTVRDYSHWALNKEENSISFTIKGRTSPMLILNSKVILLPSLASEGVLCFNGWYTDSSCTTLLPSYEITASTISLYGTWAENTNKYIITFDTRGGTPVDPIISQFGTTVTLSTSASTSKNSCTLAWWENDFGDIISNTFIIPAYNITLHAVWKCTHIASAEDLVDFSKVANSGTSFSGTTIYLDSDIAFTDELSQQFNPIATFLGTFDGQGYTINNLKIKSTLQYVGLFGFSTGATIRNVVMDSSCSITSYCDGNDYALLGSVIGQFQSSGYPCIIENIMNMASTTFNGNVTENVFMGGIAGCLYSSSNFDSFIRNCANYGLVTNKGIARGYVELGGVAGIVQGDSSSSIYIVNCLNQGTIEQMNLDTMQAIGAIVGVSYSRIIIDNCVNVGNIDSVVEGSIIGQVAGHIQSDTQITHCYWSNSAGFGRIYGDSTDVAVTISDCSSFNETTFKLTERILVGNHTKVTLINALNAVSDYYALRDYSHWALNKEENSISFTIKGRTSPMFTLSSKVILLPSLASEGVLCFNGWYTDSSCTTLLPSYEITASTTSLYGTWTENTNKHIITFDTRGGTPVDPITLRYLSNVSLPNDTSRDNCVIGFWENDFGDTVSWEFSVPAHDITLHVVWKCTRITSAGDLVDFSKVVNSGTTFNGSTIYLDSDIIFTDELSQQFEPIGDYHNHFLGTFDGQGHTISSLNIYSLSWHTGLIGYSYGTAIKNVVMDSSCSVASYYSNNYPHVGGILAYCKSSSSPCTIESIVNIANVSYKGSLELSFPYIGGIIGYVYYYKHECTVRNCANYGPITSPGVSVKPGYLGGIVGYSQGMSSSSHVSIQNCINYGSIVFNRADEYDLYLGGIIGWSSYSVLENCVSAGEISSNTVNSSLIGSIVGLVESYYTNITHCFWTSDVGYNVVNGTGNPTIKDSSEVELNTATLNTLNEYTENNSTLSKWVMLHLNGGKINNLVKDPLAGLIQSLPIVTKEGHSFLFWCTDAGCNDQYNSKTSNISEVSDLYAHWDINSYTVTFDFNNGTILSVEFTFNHAISYPDDPKREGYIFDGWSPKPERMPAEDITVKAQWDITNPSEYVEIVFGNVNLKEEDIKEIVQGYTDDNFFIEKFEVDETSGRVTVIVKFIDEEKASDFIRNINEHKRTEDYIEYVKAAVDYKKISFSFIIRPMFHLNFFLY